MGTEQKEEEAFQKEVRPDLTIALLTRADYAGETMRAMLFAASGAALGFVAIGQPPRSPWHLGPVAFFIAAAVVVFLSWRRQKLKAIDKYNAVLKEGVGRYVELQKEWGENEKVPFRPDWNLNWSSNLVLDSCAAMLLGIGVAIEIIFYLFKV